MPPDPKRLGKSGEFLFSFMFSYFDYFDVYFMGDRTPVIDFILEINDKNTPYQCMVQVKSTSKGVDEHGRLLAKLTETDKKKLISRPLPTYLVGIDLLKLDLYLCPIFDKKIKYSSYIQSVVVFSLYDEAKWQSSLEKLKDDVVNYWKSSGITGKKEQYTSILL